MRLGVTRVKVWGEVIELAPRSDVVTNAAIGAQIRATRLPWKVRDRMTGIEMVLIPPGKYIRGASPDDSQAFSNERPAHEVTISTAFYLGVNEVTQSEWSKLMGSNPSRF